MSTQTKHTEKCTGIIQLEPVDKSQLVAMQTQILGLYPDQVYLPRLHITILHQSFPKMVGAGKTRGDKMLKQAYKINQWGKNVYVKIPVVNSKGIFMGPIIKRLSKDKIKLNITAVYSLNQTKKILNCLNKDTKSIISIFAGRMSDKGIDPLPILKKSILLCKKFKNIHVLWASTREAYNYTQAKQLKCNIITMPPKIISQIDSFGKSFKEMTINTVKGFLLDSKKSKFKI